MTAPISGTVNTASTCVEVPITVIAFEDVFPVSWGVDRLRQVSYFGAWMILRSLYLTPQECSMSGARYIGIECSPVTAPAPARS